MSATPEARDRLATYRSMRDAAKTPEPVPAEPAIPSDGRSFVIQEHHARRLHWDFRLEHDGVLVSWALPKGVPTSGTDEPPRRAHRGPPARVRHLRGQHPRRRVRRRRGHDLGRRHLRAREVARRRGHRGAARSRRRSPRRSGQGRADPHRARRRSEELARSIGWRSTGTPGGGSTRSSASKPSGSRRDQRVERSAGGPRRALHRPHARDARHPAVDQPRATTGHSR